ncbi:MAG: NAD(P)/FAD-dependent oxidoreductase [Dehalococcoidia bacterium]
MPDESFDAVIIGGGTKALFLAMYLTRYGGMSVGVFERRHEVGGCLATEETTAGGFRGNTHANVMLPWYYAPLWRDFPRFWDYGGRIDQYPAADGASFINDENCLVIYSDKHDPGQERSAAEIARFSSRDAENWLKLWELWQLDSVQQVQIDMLFNPAEYRMTAEVLERQMAVYPVLVEAGFEPDSLILAASQIRAAREFWESPQLQYCVVRFGLTSVLDVNEVGSGANSFGITATIPTLGFARGGTHQIAHAAHQILTGLGCRFFTHAHVDKIIIENGAARAIALKDGSRIEARKLVVSTANPSQLCFELIGREYLNERIKRRVELLETGFSCYMDYSFALHEAPKYAVAEFNPDVNYCFWLGLTGDADPEHVARECQYRKLGEWPPVKDYNPVIWCHSIADPSYAPEGKHIAVHEQLGPPASAYSSEEWGQIRERYMHELVSLWQKHAPNMTWDNIIGCHANTPYDNLRMSNLGPDGSNAIIDYSLYQRNENRPIPELANHRTPIRNLYATGASWHPGANASSAEAYNCYKIIATDLGLGKPWEEAGKEEPDSLVHQVNIIRDSIRTEHAV